MFKKILSRKTTLFQGKTLFLLQNQGFLNKIRRFLSEILRGVCGDKCENVLHFDGFNLV